MSIEFEIEAGDPRDVVLGVDAYTNRAIVDMQDNRGYGAGATFTADQLRRLRRFLEYCYPASEDRPHEPDPWEPGGEGAMTEGHDIAPTLRWLLRVAGDEWGPLGVAIAAADVVGRKIVVAALTMPPAADGPIEAPGGEG